MDPGLANKLFLSTLSLRRATTTIITISIASKFLSTLSLRRATLLTSVVSSAGTIDFYPRSPCGERRPPSVTPAASRNFYPRSPCGERQQTQRLKIPAHRISIHALLAESDPSIRHISQTRSKHFYPRSPCGERQPAERHASSQQEFLSTLSLRRATHYDNYNLHCVEISIHALLAESDSKSAQNSGALLRI